jgi:hypothetical protein
MGIGGVTLTSHCTNLSSLYFRIAGRLHALDRHAMSRARFRRSPLFSFRPCWPIGLIDVCSSRTHETLQTVPASLSCKCTYTDYQTGSTREVCIAGPSISANVSHCHQARPGVRRGSFSHFAHSVDFPVEQSRDECERRCSIMTWGVSIALDF